MNPVVEFSELEEEGYSWMRELLTYVREHGDSIYVRARVDGKMSTVALNDLTPEEWTNTVLEFMKKGITPARVLKEEERVDRREG